ncbi:hypothetical protein [Pseudalkalibacillus sp. SCS-8]|uniref:hypothetical protein n=1 Tax=Pseudalkalibacillus nanhaiensis TaxID=3115291 RepID=UPI0032DB28E5
MQSHVLFEIAEQFNALGIRWGVGGSNVLAHHGIIDSPRDLDLIVHLYDAKPALERLEQYGTRTRAETSYPFRTKVFQTYIKDDTSIDFMSGFAIEHDQGIYTFLLDEHATMESVRKDGRVIPYTSLEDWYVLYQLIPNKGRKADLIESYWLTNGIDQPELLSRAANQPLPSEVRSRINRFIL